MHRLRSFGPTALLIAAAAGFSAAAEPATFLELPYRYVIGGFRDGKWLTSEQAGKTIAPGAAFRLFTLKGEAGRVTARRAGPDVDVCPDVWIAALDTEPDETPAIAVAAPWNPLPRPVKIADNTVEVYVKAVAEILAGQGIRKPDVRITQHLRVDLDGDGEEEVLLAATHYPTADGEGSAPTASGPGDYSFVALRRVVDGRVVTQILDGEFYEKAQEFNAPNVHHVGGLLDLDGDGVMEIVLHSQYYEGGATTLWKLGPKGAEKVLEIGCGV
ncbi:MAG: hypothetical protein H7A52_15700 [Akkermansiaceae bacterium]|nr:hypothetical protein [Akkermansiaceae bacterium]